MTSRDALSWRRLVLLWALGLAGCGEPLPPLDLPGGCQPLLGGEDCLLPFPSDFFLEPDPSMPSGARLTLPRSAKPKTDRGASADVGEWRAVDGASRMAMPTAFLGVPLSGDGLVGYLDDAAQSARADSQTLLVDTSTGAFIPHFAEVDPRASTPERQALVLHPLAPLAARTRYIVALQGLRLPGGTTAPAPEGFRRIRDRQARGDSALAPLAERFEAQVFPVLERALVRRASLQLAWDFTVGSDEHLARDLLRVRALTQAWLEAHVPEVTVTEVTPSAAPDLWRTVRGTFQAPRFLASDAPTAGLHRGADGRVAQNGALAVPFFAVIPAQLRDAPGPAGTLCYGHGSFGSSDELLATHTRQLASGLRAVLFGTDWVGMSRADVGHVLQAIASDPVRAFTFTERVPQGMANWMALTAAIEGPLRTLPAFQDDGGLPLYAADASRFLGVSQGHILGGVLAAVHPKLRRIALGSGGAGFSHMLSRSRPLTGFFLVLEMTDELQRRKFESLLQPYFDAIDGAFWARHVQDEPLPGALARQVLMQTGLGDVEVPNVGTFLHARALKLPLLSPSPIAVSGLTTVAAPTEGSALSLFDMGVDLAEVYGEAQPFPSENEVHLGARLLPAAVGQLESFFATGQVRHLCDGPCDPD